MRFLLSISFLLISMAAFAQDGPHAIDMKKHKVIIQLTSDDTLVHKALIKQIGNIQVALPNCQIEVVCHSNGITFLTAAKTKYADKIKEYKKSGVFFAACENTLRERKISKDEIVPDAGFVPSGVAEVILKQEKGW